MNAISFVITLHWGAATLFVPCIYIRINYAMKQHTINVFKAIHAVLSFRPSNSSPIFQRNVNTGWEKRANGLLIKTVCCKFKRQQNNFNNFFSSYRSNMFQCINVLCAHYLKISENRSFENYSAIWFVCWFEFFHGIHRLALIHDRMQRAENSGFDKCIYQHTIKFYGIETCSVNFRLEFSKYLQRRNTTSNRVEIVWNADAHTRT